MSDKAGKGMLYLTVANATLFIAGFIISMALARILEIDSFGVYGVVVSLVSTVNIIFITGFKQTVSKFVAEQNGLTPTENKKLFSLVFLMILLAFTFLYFGAGFIAGLFNDSGLAPFIQIVSFLILTYGVYSFVSGYIAGLRKFKWDAGLRALYSFLKVLFIVGFAAFTFDIVWALWGFVAASAAVLAAGIIVYLKLAKKQKRDDVFGYWDFSKFVIPLVFFVVTTTLLTNLDLLMVKAISPFAVANSSAAYYNVASTISKLPSYAVLALSTVLLPVISHWTRKKRMDKVRFYISNINRYSIMFLALVATAISATSPQLVGLLFSAKYVPSAFPLSLLIFGVSFYALFSVLASVVSGHGKPIVPTAIAFFVLALDFVLNLILIPEQGLIGAAIASSASMFLAFILIAYYVLVKFKVFCSLLSLSRILAAGIIAYLVALATALPGFFLLITYVMTAAVYFALLYLTGELTKRDVEILKGAVF